ncbi:MAG: asparagine synthase (glutamine-hydrolyzing), partial [Nitrospinota bacterium]|nr:asparagine synthase (glutamine-hydrolyzing) [Nitrospinota bacterium]
GRQPMSTPDGRYILVFNGEIYNYIELRKSLIASGVSFQTSSDTEVLLQMLIRKGTKCLNELNGMFAFAFFDRKNGKWILARDHFGIKPLYYITLKNKIVFASEIKALLEHPEIKAEYDLESIHQYLTFQFCLGERTLFRKIQKLAPGSYMTGTGEKVEAISQYWRMKFHLDENHDEEYFASHLRFLIEDGVHLQLRSDVPLGAYLSGGLDSSTVAAIAAEYIGPGMKAFNGFFPDGPDYDESNFARVAAENVQAELLSIGLSPQQFVEDMPSLIYAMDEPAAGPGLFPQYQVSKMTSRHVKVVLGGQGGDELFGGYARYLLGYLEQALKGAIFETQEEGKHVVTLSSIIPNLPILRSYQPLMRYFWKDGLFEDMDARYFRLINRNSNIKKLLTKDAAAQFDHPAVFEEFQKVFNHPDTKSYVNKMIHFDMKEFLPSLLQVEDRVSMAVSIESRVPLLDVRIAELMCSMPPKIKFKGGESKSILKKAIKKWIPDSIFKRKDKMGFPVPLTNWMSKEPVRGFFHDTLLSKASKQRGLFNPVALENLIHRETNFGRQLWGALCLELWHQNFIDG